MSAESGTIDFGDINVDVRELAKIFERYVAFGSRRFKLSIQDITVYANPIQDFEGKESASVTAVGNLQVANTLLGLMAAGAKFIDAVIYLGLPNARKPNPREHPVPKGATPATQISFPTYNSPPKIARCMFFYYFYVLTRAKAPSGSADEATQPVPNFLSSVLAYKESAGEVAEYLASFELNFLDHRWVRHIRLNHLSVESLNRFGLGVAGYRMASPFKLYQADTALATDRANAIEVATSIARSPASWDIHPATRDPNILTKYGNLNKNLGNLILDVFSPAKIQEMCDAKVLFSVPKREPAHTNYLRWTIADVFAPQTTIFEE